jgi:histidine triad (HIT) family protein
MNSLHPDCHFCNLLDDLAGVSIVYHDAHLVVIFEQNEATDCHAVLVPRAHAASLLDLPPETATKMMYVASLLEKAVPEVVGSAGLALWQSDPETLEVGTDLHFHIHLVSHNEGDGRVVWLPTRESPSPEEVEPMVARLRDHLRDTPPEGLRLSVVRRILEQRHIQGS